MFLLLKGRLKVMTPLDCIWLCMWLCALKRRNEGASRPCTCVGWELNTQWADWGRNGSIAFEETYLMMKWGHLPSQAAGRAQLSDGSAIRWRERRWPGGGGDGGV